MIKRMCYLVFFMTIMLYGQVPLCIDLDFLNAKKLSVYYWNPFSFTNFGDYLSIKLVERIIGSSVDLVEESQRGPKLIAIGSVLSRAADGDIIWGTGTNSLNMEKYRFNNLDVRAVRGPITRKILLAKGIACPEVYGDPALLIPYLFPEFKKAEEPVYDYVIVPHYLEEKYFPKDEYPQVVYPTEPWDQVIKKIIQSKFVIAGSLHGIIIAEAFGIPARLLRITGYGPSVKFKDYYAGTGRPSFKFAKSVKEALALGGEAPAVCDLVALYKAFPFDYWSQVKPDLTLFS